MAAPFPPRPSRHACLLPAGRPHAVGPSGPVPWSSLHLPWLFRASLEKCPFRPFAHLKMGVVCLFVVKLWEIFVSSGCWTRLSSDERPAGRLLVLWAGLSLS